MEFTKQIQDYSKGIAQPDNYKFGTLLWFNNSISEFLFPGFLQGEDFWLQTAQRNFDGTVSFVNYLQLNNTNKESGYFDSYSASLVNGVYRIKAGDWFSRSLIKVINPITFDNDNYNYFTRNAQDYLKGIAKGANFGFGNIEWDEDRAYAFKFDSDFQALDFWLQKGTYNHETGSILFENFQQINNTYKQTEYFETHNVTLPKGIYRIKVGDYYSRYLIEIVDAYAIDFPTDGFLFLTDEVFEFDNNEVFELLN